MNKQSPVTTIEKGNYGGLDKAATFVIKNKRDWDTAFQGNKDLPEVNFRTHVLVALFRGRCPSGGYGIKVTTLYIDEALQNSDTGRLVSIVYEYTYPQPGYMYTQALTTPYLIVALPKWRNTQYQVVRAGAERARTTTGDTDEDEAARKQRADSLREQIDKLVQGKE